MRLLILAAAVLLLQACSSGPPALTYDDGLHDGWAQTCNQLDRLSARTVREIHHSGICR